MAYKTVFAACALAATVADAHIVLAKPKPYAFYNDQNQPGVFNRPLSADGSDFPCRAPSSDVYTDAPTEFALGSTMDIAFTGQAVHGGGSCQFSLTTDTTPTKESKWHVIHSIIGGCPARGETANMGDDPNVPDPYLYNFTLPSDIPAGTYTLAWSWNNRIGNREFYMNCAPLKLTGTGGPKSNLDSLPDMFVSNLAGVNECNTVAESSQDVVYPAPGSSVEHVEPLNGGWKQLNPGDSVPACATGFCVGGTNCNMGGGSQPGQQTQSQQYPASTPSPVSTPAATSPAEATPAASTPGGVYQSATEAADTPSATPVAATSAAAPVATSSAAASSGAGYDSGSSSGSASGSGSSSGKSTGACSPEGQFNCIDGKTYQQCASGTWSVAMPVAPGTSCDVGKTMQLSVKASAQKRSAKVFQA